MSYDIDWDVPPPPPPDIGGVKDRLNPDTYEPDDDNAETPVQPLNSEGY